MYFTTNYIALQSILQEQVDLEVTFSSQEWYDNHKSNSVAWRIAEQIVSSYTFWMSCQMVVNISELVVKGP